MHMSDHHEKRDLATDSHTKFTLLMAEVMLRSKDIDITDMIYKRIDSQNFLGLFSATFFYEGLPIPYPPSS